MSSLDHKADFPIFTRTPHVYLDSAATSHKPQVVIDAMCDFYSHRYGTVRRGLYHLSSQATTLFEEVRSQAASFIGAAKPSEIIFTSGATESINLVAQAYLRPLINSNDEIIITTLEHHANFIPWQQLAIEKNARLIVLPVNEQNDINHQYFRDALSHKTKMVALTHVSNVTGGINPVQTMIREAHQAGAKVLIDGAQSIGHLPIDVRKMDCDFYVFSAHKMYGPTGTGVLYGKEEILNAMPPYRFGGEMILEVTNETSHFKNAPHRFEAGTPNIAGVIGLGAAIKYVENIGLDKIGLYEKEITSYLLNKLEESGVQIIGNPVHQSSLVSFLIDDIHPHDAATILDGEAIAVRAGHHCAQPLMRYLKIPATIRASLAWYNGKKDIDRLIEGINKVRKIMQ